MAYNDDRQQYAVTHEHSPPDNVTSRLRVQSVNEDPSLTVQSLASETDINHIINRYDQTGLIKHLNRAEAQFADVTEVSDYRTALEQVRAADEVFSQLPATVRQVFNNDPAQFLDAAHDPDKRDLLVKAGLLDPDDHDVPATPEPPAKPSTSEPSDPPPSD